MHSFGAPPSSSSSFPFHLAGSTVITIVLCNGSFVSRSQLIVATRRAAASRQAVSRTQRSFIIDINDRDRFVFLLSLLSHFPQFYLSFVPLVIYVIVDLLLARSSDSFSVSGVSVFVILIRIIIIIIIIFVSLIWLIV